MLGPLSSPVTGCASSKTRAVMIFVMLAIGNGTFSLDAAMSPPLPTTGMVAPSPEAPPCPPEAPPDSPAPPVPLLTSAIPTAHAPNPGSATVGAVGRSALGATIVGTSTGSGVPSATPVYNPPPRRSSTTSPSALKMTLRRRRYICPRLALSVTRSCSVRPACCWLVISSVIPALQKAQACISEASPQTDRSSLCSRKRIHHNRCRRRNIERVHTALHRNTNDPIRGP